MKVDRSNSTAPVSMKSDKPSKPGKKTMDEITIRPVDNGFSVKTRYREDGKESYMSNTVIPLTHGAETGKIGPCSGSTYQSQGGAWS